MLQPGICISNFSPLLLFQAQGLNEVHAILLARTQYKEAPGILTKLLKKEWLEEAVQFYKGVGLTKAKRWKGSGRL